MNLSVYTCCLYICVNSATSVKCACIITSLLCAKIVTPDIYIAPKLGKLSYGNHYKIMK